VTWLSAAGVHPRTAQTLARHTDIRLTMASYTDPRLLDLQAAVEQLPELTPAPEAAACATGTEDVRAETVVPSVVPSVVPGVVLTGRDTTGQQVRGRRAERPQTVVLSSLGRRCPELANTTDNGGGGNRTPVPKHFGLSLYVRSRSISVLSPPQTGRQVIVGPSPAESRRRAAGRKRDGQPADRRRLPLAGVVGRRVGLS